MSWNSGSAATVVPWSSDSPLEPMRSSVPSSPPPDDLYVGHTNAMVSPELALVDPALGEHARAWLPSPEDTLDRIERIVRARRLAASRAALRTDVRALPTREAPTPYGSPAPRTRTARTAVGQRRPALVAGGVAAAILVAALLVGVRVDVRGTPAGADTTTISAAPVEPPVPVRQPTPRRKKPKTQSNSGTSKTPQKAPSSGRSKTPQTAPTRQTNPAAPRRFAWAPVEGASGYHVEFFRGSARVFSADTRGPDVSLPRAWKLGGERRTLVPGEYRWYVWPIVAGRRSSKATIQAQLVVPQR